MTRDLYLTADMADALAAAGLKCRTPAAVRSAVEQGRLNPDLETPRGVKAWSHEALLRDVESMWRRHRIRSLAGFHVREPKQLEIGG
jgi:hypothetical protein